MPSRAEYVAQRIGARMQNRGDPMVLRRTSTDPGPVPYKNPPDVSSDAVVITGVTDVNSQAYLGISGSSIIGRLVAGDVITVQLPHSQFQWLVDVMPTDIETDSDGIIIVDGSGNPTPGTPTLYSPDSLAANDAWPAVPVSVAGTPDPAGMIGGHVSFTFAADQNVYGATMSFEEQIALGWTEVDSIGVRLAAYNAGLIAPPKVDDLLFVAGTVRSIIAVGSVFRQSVNLLYQVQVK